MKKLIAAAAIIALAVWILPARADHGSPSDHIAEIRAALNALEADLEAEPSPDPTEDPDPTPTQEPDPEPTTTPDPDPDPTPVGEGIWLSTEEIASLPMSGTGWEDVLSAAQGNWGTADVGQNDSHHDTYMMAGALVAARTGDEAMRSRVSDALMGAIGTEGGAKPTSLGRNLAGYVIAADLIDFAGHDPGREQQFRSWLTRMQTHEVDGMTLAERHSVRLSNHGTMSGGARIALAIYLGDQDELDAAAHVTAGYLGQHDDHDLFFGGDRGWMCDQDTFTGINPDCTVAIDGAQRAVGGVLPAESQRCGAPGWPPCKTNYIGGGLQGITMQAELLRRQGFPVLQWGDQALSRAFDRMWAWDQDFGGWWGDGGNGQIKHLPSLAEFWFDKGRPQFPRAGFGQNYGWTEWSHGTR